MLISVSKEQPWLLAWRSELFLIASLPAPFASPSHLPASIRMSLSGSPQFSKTDPLSGLAGTPTTSSLSSNFLLQSPPSCPSPFWLWAPCMIKWLLLCLGTSTTGRQTHRDTQTCPPTHHPHAGHWPWQVDSTAETTIAQETSTKCECSKKDNPDLHARQVFWPFSLARANTENTEGDPEPLIDNLKQFKDFSSLATLWQSSSYWSIKMHLCFSRYSSFLPQPWTLYEWIACLSCDGLGSYFSLTGLPKTLKSSKCPSF